MTSMPTQYPVFIISFNRLTWLKAIVEQVKALDGAIPVIVDNGSTYPPLVEWLFEQEAEGDYENGDFLDGFGLKDNHGCYTIWMPIESMRIESGKPGKWRDYTPLAAYSKIYGSFDYYCVTDHDLDLAGVPADCLHIMRECLDLMPEYTKVGLNLEIRDIPDKCILKEEVLKNERPAWNEKNKIHFNLLGRSGPTVAFTQNIDTTFAMYRTFDRIIPFHGYPGLRLGRPYTAKHRPWYQGIEDFTEEDLFYMNSCKGTNSTYWTEVMNMALQTRAGKDI